tara:strand:- start:7503 stop:7733 length:231 start_codon:yes stop_codon:yes gene_type:complete
MPYTIRKVRNRRCYRVENAKTKRVFAKCTSKAKAESQVRLLRAIENNKNFILRPEKRKVTKRSRNNVTMKKRKTNV